ncbi:MAG: hypothetical protein JWO94_2722 [Verrucomicrobiaceae bacterium]|nr:hypothetical protein [Verrucomicrobiaceae bacterium]
MAGCLWLPRIIAKARLLQADLLPDDYLLRFCAANGVDGMFLGFFGLTRDDILGIAPYTNRQVIAWFKALPAAKLSRIKKWNATAENFGRPGFPMTERLEYAKNHAYTHLDTSGVETIFGMIELDERITADLGQAG